MICLNKTLFYVLVSLFTFVIFAALFKEHIISSIKGGEAERDEDSPHSSGLSSPGLVSSIPHTWNRLFDLVRYEDSRRAFDPMVPPVARDPFNMISPHYTHMPPSVPTRGEYGPFQQLGFISGDSKTLPLFGRRTHSRQYEYYTMTDGVKIPVNSPNKNQFNNGDAVTIPGFETTFTVTNYDTDGLKYIPY
jgi:hypothetical protein